MTTPTQAGPLSPWITANEFAIYRPKVTNLDPATLVTAIRGATDLLYRLSGRQFSGECEAVLRPTARPITWSLDRWRSYYANLTGNSWAGAWGSCQGDSLHSLCSTPPQIDLGLYPLNSITQILLDGEVLAPDQYKISDSRWLVRALPSSNAVPQGRYGWPTCQDLRLPSSERGTLEVTALYGMAPPELGKIGCAALAAELGKAGIGLDHGMLSRITSVSRQGVSTSFLSIVDATKEGLTGVVEADQFIRSVNPAKRQRQPMVWSPDFGTVRRTS